MIISLQEMSPCDKDIKFQAKIAVIWLTQCSCSR